MPQATSETRWTLIPERIAASLFSAAARIWSPIVVSRKKSAKSATQTAATPIVIRSNDETRTPLTSKTREGKTVWYGSSITPQ